MSTPDEINPLLLEPDSLNPYRLAAGFIKTRLRWDMRPESWRSRRMLRSWKDRFPGKKAVILCNGPSLLKVDFNALHKSGVFCFGLNKINLLFQKTDFRPTCVVAVNPFVIEQNADFYNSTQLPLFLDSCAIKKVQSRDNTAFLHSNPFPRFSKDCSISVWQGYTVTFVAMQLAYHMGFTEVALVGADHTFSTKGPANKTVVSGQRDDNHFDPNYFAGGMRWQLPDLFQSEVAYTMARDMFSASGRRIVNATAGGELEVFERSTLADFLVIA